MATLATSYTTNDFSLRGLLDQFIASDNYIGLRVLTPLSVPQKAGKFPLRSARAMQRRASSVGWGIGGEPALTGSEYGKGSFDCKDYALSVRVPDRLKSELIEISDLTGSEVGVAANQLALEHEARVSARIINTTTWALSGDTGKTTATNWNTTASALPLEDINEGHSSIFRRCGAQRSQLSLILPSHQVFNNLCANRNLRESIGFGFAYGENATLPTDVFARALGLREVLIGGMVFDSTPDQPTRTMTNIWDPAYAWLGVLGQSNNFQEPCVGRTFAYDPDGGILSTGPLYRDDRSESDMVNVKQSVDEVVFSSDFGYLIKIVP